MNFLLLKKWLFPDKPKKTDLEYLQENIKYLQTNTYFYSYLDLVHYINQLHEASYYLDSIPEDKQLEYYEILYKIFQTLVRTIDKSDESLCRYDCEKIFDIQRQLNKIKAT